MFPVSYDYYVCNKLLQIFQCCIRWYTYGNTLSYNATSLICIAEPLSKSTYDPHGLCFIQASAGMDLQEIVWILMSAWAVQHHVPTRMPCAQILLAPLIAPAAPDS